MRMNLKSIALAASLGMTVAVTGLTGCKTQGRSYGQYHDDRKVAGRVKDALKDEPIYKYPAVNVTSYQGIVQLSGFVPMEEQRKRAGEIASTAPGVKEVVNNILVKPDLAPTGTTNAPVRLGQPSTTGNAPAPQEQSTQPTQPSK